MEAALLPNSEGRRKVGGTVSRFIDDIKEEGHRLGYLSGPMVAMSLSQFLVQVSSSMMVGHLGELALSSSAIATSLAGVTGFSLLIGMGSGLDTLCGQAYGAKQYKKLSIHAYSALISLLLVCIPISILWMSLGNLLVFIGLDPSISHEAAKYAIWMIPGLVASATVQPMMKFLQSQSLILPMMLSSILTLCIHIPLTWVMVFKSRLGFVGAALSISITYWLNAFILGLYIKYSKACASTRAPFSMDALSGIGDFMKLALPSAIMICLEWWSFELLVLLSGLLPNPELETSVLSICLSSISCLYTIPYALGAGVSTRISNELGAGNSEAARRSVRVVMFIAVTESFTVAITLFLLRGVVGYAYSNVKEVTDYVTQIIPLLCISVVMDSIQGVLSGVARGCGWQHIGAYINLGAFYIFGIPVAVALAFVWHVGGTGLWIGILCGATVQTILLAIVTSCTNWRQQAINARERVFDEKLPIQDALK